MFPSAHLTIFKYLFNRFKGIVTAIKAIKPVNIGPGDHLE